MDVYQFSAQWLKVLAHPTRLRLLAALRGKEECVCHLTTLLQQRQAFVSQQLMFLRQAGILADRKDGVRVYYRIKDPRVVQVLEVVNALGGERKLPIAPKTMVACPCPKCEQKNKRTLR